MSEVRIKIFPAQDSAGQLELNMNKFLEEESIGYIEHTVSTVSIPGDLSYSSTYSNTKLRQYKTHYVGSIAYRDKNKGHHHD